MHSHIISLNKDSINKLTRKIPQHTFKYHHHHDKRLALGFEAYIIIDICYTAVSASIE